MTSEIKQKKPKILILFYAMTIAFTVLALYMIYYSFSYMQEYYTSYGMSMSDSIGTCIQYMVTTVSPFFLYALLSFGVTLILRKLEVMHPTEPKVKKSKVEASAISSDEVDATNVEAEIKETDEKNVTETVTAVKISSESVKKDEGANKEVTSTEPLPENN